MDHLSVLSEDALARDLAIADLTDPASGPHAHQTLVADITAALTTAWGCDLRIIRAGPVVSVADNYDRLGFDPADVTRDARYSRYVGADTLLRTHTSAMIPGALRALAREPGRALARDPADVLLACPGLVWRRDVIDRLHTGTPHQLDLWRIRDGRPMRIADLYDMIARVVAAALPGAAHRTTPVAHPYTEQGREIEVEWNGEWIEIGECGLAGPSVLAGAGLAGSTGLAMGLGLDRMLMLRKGIPDIRLLRSRDPRVVEQMANLDPYRPVSNRPAITRDLSVAVDDGTDAEQIGDRVRDALESDGPSVESVAVVGETSFDELPSAARARLGMREGQTNVLLRVVFRDLDRTLTDVEANTLRDRVYAAVHQGDAHQWATNPPPPTSRPTRV